MTCVNSRTTANRRDAIQGPRDRRARARGRRSHATLSRCRGRSGNSRAPKDLRSAWIERHRGTERLEEIDRCRIGNDDLAGLRADEPRDLVADALRQIDPAGAVQLRISPMPTRFRRRAGAMMAAVAGLKRVRRPGRPDARGINADRARTGRATAPARQGVPWGSQTW